MFKRVLRSTRLLLTLVVVALVLNVYLYLANALNAVHCYPDVPCQYPERVDLRIIVITFDRPTSLMKLLQSIDGLEMDGDTGILEIWIDRRKGTNDINEKTLQIAQSFSWSRGKTRVHVQKKHVGIYGQWIDTWRPPSGGKELALFLEDDLTVSPYAYRWLKAVHKKYGSRNDIAGYTLQSEGVNLATTGRALKRPTNQTVFLYKLLGSWGYAPHPDSWLAFQDWYHRARKDVDFHPYVPKAARITRWYKRFEKEKRQDSMWSVWHVYYCDKHNMYTVYNNIKTVTKDKKILLAANRNQAGLHFKHKLSDNTNQILKVWSDKYVKLPDSPVRVEFDGTPRHD